MENKKLVIISPDGTPISIGGKRVGEIYFTAFPPDDLDTGEYFANGALLPLDSPQGQVLNSLGISYKTNWNIQITGNSINLPNMFSSDGQGMTPVVYLGV